MTTATEPRIDVERLAAAMRSSHQNGGQHGNCTWSSDHQHQAAHVAAEYDRLTPVAPARIAAADAWPSPGYIETGPTEGGVGSE